MGTMEDLLSRRSIRKYTSQPVSDDLIQELLEAAMSAPSAGNEQPWHFIVIKERTLLDQIPTVHPHSHMITGALLAILVCCDLSLVKHEGFWVQDCAAATENVLIAVQAKGLGAVWLGVYPREARIVGLRRLFGIPDRVVPFALIPIGYPAEERPREHRFDPSKVHYNCW